MLISTPSLKSPAVSTYLLLIEPRKDLQERIQHIKQEFYTRYKVFEDTLSHSSLSLVRYSQFQGFETRIVQHLRNIAKQTAPFSIDLKDFGSLPSHTIFINVATTIAFQNLVKNIRTPLQNLMKQDKDHKPHFMPGSNITIAHRLRPWQYEQGWQEYSTKYFSGSFIATTMTLLKKDQDAHKYNPLEVFEFQNTPIYAKQATLF